MKPRDFTRFTPLDKTKGYYLTGLTQDKDFKPQRHRDSKGQKKYFLTRLTGLEEIKKSIRKPRDQENDKISGFLIKVLNHEIHENYFEYFFIISSC